MSAAEQERFEALLRFLQQQRGFDFTGYKRPSLMRRMLRRMQTVSVHGFEAYRDYLEVHPEEFALLFNTILINVTSFFRDPPAWRFVETQVLPEMLASKGTHAPVRVWSAGCASGQEAYSIAMLLAEALGDEAFRERVKVYATDADEEALAQARHAAYTPKDMEEVPPRLRERYFDQASGRYVFRPDLRRSVIFGRHDLVQDAPISRLDLLVCRNTLMYFNAETQAKVMSRFHFALNGHDNGAGYLFLGRAEMLLTQSSLFSALDLKCRVFSKLQLPGIRPRAPALAIPGNPDEEERDADSKDRHGESCPGSGRPGGCRGCGRLRPHVQSGGDHQGRPDHEGRHEPVLRQDARRSCRSGQEARRTARLRGRQEQLGQRQRDRRHREHDQRRREGHPDHGRRRQGRERGDRQGQEGGPAGHRARLADRPEERNRRALRHQQLQRRRADRQVRARRDEGQEGHDRDARRARGVVGRQASA